MVFPWLSLSSTAPDDWSGIVEKVTVIFPFAEPNQLWACGYGETRLEYKASVGNASDRSERILWEISTTTKRRLLPITSFEPRYVRINVSKKRYLAGLVRQPRGDLLLQLSGNSSVPCNDPRHTFREAFIVIRYRLRQTMSFRQLYHLADRSLQRTRRDTSQNGGQEPHPRNQCTLQTKVVHFAEIGYDHIVYPKKADIKECRGSCTFRISPAGRPKSFPQNESNYEVPLHDLVQQLNYRRLNEGPAVTRCCRPIAHHSLTVLVKKPRHSSLAAFRLPKTIATDCACANTNNVRGLPNLSVDGQGFVSMKIDPTLAPNGSQRTPGT